MATIQTFFLVNNIVNITLRLSVGGVPPISLVDFGLVVLGLLVGIAAGLKMYSKLNGETLKKYIYAVLAVAGLWIAIGG